jgi:hypothetical protein
VFVPVLLPFNFHWYTGAVPPFEGLAVNVTMLPAHAEVAGTLMVTDGVTAAGVAIVITLDVAVDVVTQTALDVTTQLTWSPSAKVIVEKKALLNPAFTPFTFHW